MQKYKGDIFIPQIGADPAEILDLKNKWFNDEASFRLATLEEIAKSIHYVLGEQWIELDTRLIRPGAGGFRFREKDPGARYPKPVTNLIASSVEVEMASLAKRELVPNVLTTSKDPRIQAAARVAKDVLNYRLKKLDWNSARELVTYLTIVTGTGILKSYWDEPITETTSIGNPEAQICPECGTLSASPTVGADDIASAGIKHVDTMQPKAEQTPGMPTQLDMTHCPACDEEVPLTPFDMTAEDANGTDFLGRPLGQQVTKGNTGLEVVSPFDFFPENSGIGVTPEGMKFFGQATVRPLEWICERYPESEPEPEDPQQLMRIHPILGRYRYFGGFSAGYDSNIYGNHARVFEFYAEKCYGFPDGRAIVVCNDKILLDGPLYRTVGGISVPLVKYTASRFKTKHGIFWGQGLVADLISPQNRLNGMDSQIVEARERTGSPNLIIPEAAGVEGPEFFEDDYGSGKIFFYKTDPLNPNAKPEVFGNMLMPQGVWEERNNVKEDMKQIAGPQDVEIGEAPKNITTTSGLQLLGESAERKRGARERPLIEMFQKIWEHQLRMLWTLRVDKDEYEVETDEGTWELKQFSRTDIKGQTRVLIEKQAYVDKSVYIKEAAREAQADGLYRLDDAYSIKKLLELRGLPTDVNRNQNDQVDAGVQQYVDFVDEGIIPYIDPTIDDPRVRFQALGTMLESPDGKEFTAKSGWPMIVKKIAGWEDDLLKAEMLDQQVRAFYGQEAPQANAEQYASAMKGYTASKAAFDQASATPPPAEGMPGGAPPQPLMAPQPPPPPVFIPRAKEDKILMIWQGMLQKAGMVPQEQIDQQNQALAEMAQMDPGQAAMAAGTMPEQQGIPPELQSYLQFRAVVEAYRLLAQEKEMKKMMGVPTAAAPGTPEGSPGATGGPPQSVNPGNEPPNPPATPAQGQ